MRNTRIKKCTALIRLSDRNKWCRLRGGSSIKAAELSQIIIIIIIIIINKYTNKIPNENFYSDI
jgi:hypothetical protein